ncbi:citrate synthase [Tichowtungia aerotolerans]|uniref:Citrate synthase n=1 Tax=Tichowtungia aerotolerans TaxID=2697043 RepID=A0A6P1MAH8_9BACT|nr:citrate synthase [Tichowtungia aerotolerans]
MGKADIKLNDTTLTCPVYEGSEGERAIDIGKLRKETGMITYDPGFVNTGSCSSSVTFIDGEKGILRYRGYDVDDLAENCEFIEVAYLLINGSLPTREEKAKYTNLLNQHSLIHEDMIEFFRHYPEHSHPMAVLSAMAVSLSSFYPEMSENHKEELSMTVTRLLSKLRTIAAFSYKKSIGEPIVYPRHDLRYCENFLNMMFNSPVCDMPYNDTMTESLNKLLIIHADHEQNCSASVVRGVGSAGANLYAAISGGICALWGPLHGGANQHVIEMLENIMEEGGNIDKVLERAKSKRSPFRLMGFGHRVYKSYDPRAKIAKALCKEVMASLNKHDPLLDLAMELEEKALADPYFQERGLYPNVDFYTGLTYREMGIPTNMFTVMFAIGRLPGWIAQFMEMRKDPHGRISRPRQIYTGPSVRKVVPIDQR